MNKSMAVLQLSQCCYRSSCKTPHITVLKSVICCKCMYCYVFAPYCETLYMYTNVDLTSTA